MPLIYKTDKMTASHVTTHVQAIFLESGWLYILLFDKGPRYSVAKFKQAMKDMDVHLITS